MSAGIVTVFSTKPLPLFMNGGAISLPKAMPLDADIMLEPLKIARSRWPTLVSGAISVLLLAGLGRELFRGGLDGLVLAFPASPVFYLAFIAIYAVQPVSDFVIFRRLWGMTTAGIVPILRKLVANDVLLGYSGEAYLYAWARGRLNMVATPFAAIKDVSILSAVVGNVFTLLLLALATPLAYTLIPPALVGPVGGSAAVILGTSLIILLFRGRLFSLPTIDLRWVFSVHIVRTLVYVGLQALSWHLALPDVPLGIWMLLVTSRQLVARLPLVPNKDIVFANLAVLLVGGNSSISQLIALTVALTLLCHIIVFAATWLPSLNRKQA